MRKERRGNVYACEKGYLTRDGREFPLSEREEGREGDREGGRRKRERERSGERRRAIKRER